MVDAPAPVTKVPEPSQEQIQAMVDVWRVWSLNTSGLQPSVNAMMRKAYLAAMDM